MTISAVVITKNEEKNIGRCLESLQGLVDEIIVVDSMSTDRTEEICRRFSVRFIQKEWMGWSKTKNFANDLSTSAYILSLDADESLSPKLKENLLRLKSHLHGFYGFNRKTNYCGKWISHSGWYPDRKLRLFPKGLALWSDQQVHEDLIRKDLSLPVTYIEGDLLHYSYYTIFEHLERANRYSELGAEIIASSPRSFLRFRALFNALFRFFKSYLLQRGFLDGFYGFVIALIGSLEVFLKYAKADQMRSKNSYDESRRHPTPETIR